MRHPGVGQEALHTGALASRSSQSGVTITQTNMLELGVHCVSFEVETRALRAQSKIPGSMFQGGH